MKSNSKYFKARYIILIIICVVCFILFRTRKVYEFCDTKGSSTTYFTDEQLKGLDKSDSILAIVPCDVMYIKRNSLSFDIFSLNDFKTFKIKTIKVVYDGREKIFKRNISYDLDFENPNFIETVQYNVEGKIINGYKKTIFAPFMNFKYCWVNFYDLFKWTHPKIGSEFPVKMVAEYSLDNREYVQEMEYIVKCEESYPSHLYKLFLRNL